MKDFLEFGAEAVGGVPYTVYHASNGEIEKLHATPMWFTLSKDDVNEYAATKEYPVIYEAELQNDGKYGHFEDQTIMSIFNDHAVDFIDYVAMLIDWPTADQITSHEGTELLLQYGYHGFVHPDRNPLNPENVVSDNLEDEIERKTLLIFDPTFSIKSFNRE